jgi:hypothetical protein
MDQANLRQSGMTDSVDMWKRSSKCSPKGDNCVEVNYTSADNIGVRDSALPTTAGPSTLVFGSLAWQQFLASVDHLLGYDN